MHGIQCDKVVKNSVHTFSVTYLVFKQNDLWLSYPFHSCYYVPSWQITVGTELNSYVGAI